MSIRTTIFAAAAVAFSAFGAHAATVLVEGTDYDADVFVDGSLNLSLTSNLGAGVGVLAGDDFSFDQAFNLRSFTEIQLDPDVFGTGSLTISTYVDPFSLYGVGGANVLLSFGEILDPLTITVQWGGGAVQDISDGNPVTIGTFFDGVGEANAQDLIISWNELESVEQVSVNIAAIPLPAGILLLGTALGGLGLARRRRKS